GGAEPSVSDTDKVYVLISGKLTIIGGNGEEITLEPMDTLYIAPGEKRSIINKTNTPATMLVISAYPDKK
ncbi:MAG: cupin domain-containing protein, partial [Candidatus Caldarchaeum sp.]|nr:cupin domain-containing protein [Candidatus Caldarchaeum sp.]